MSIKKVYFRETTFQQRKCLFELIEETGNVSKACKRMKISRGTYYYWKERYEKDGIEGIREPKSHYPHNHYTIDPLIEKRIVAVNTVKNVLDRHGMWNADIKKKKMKNKGTTADKPNKTINIDLCFIPAEEMHEIDFSPFFQLSVNTTSAESVVVEMKEVNSRKDVPSADIVSYHIERQNYSEFLIQLQQVINFSYQQAAKRRFFGKYAALAIDIHEIPYYGEVNNSIIMGCKHNRGTSYCYKYATIDIVEKNQRFTLKAIPLTPLSNDNGKIVKELLEHAMKHVHIKYVLIDRGFFSVEVIKLLKAMDFKFIMPATKNKKIQKVIKDNQNKKSYFIKDYPMGTNKNRITFNLVVKYDEEDKEYYPFATNFEIKDEKNVENIAELYRKRWGIETGYRVKNDFLAITTTQRYTIRMLYFMVSVILYNFWLLYNVIYCREHGIELGTQKTTTRIMKLYIKMYLIDAFNEKIIAEVTGFQVSE